MILKNYITLAILLLITSGCSLLGTKQLEVVSKPVQIDIMQPDLPRPVDLTAPKWYVVSEKNLDEFMVKFKEDEGLLAFIAVSPQGYENVAMDIADMRRYILQQKDIILYYEQSLEPSIPEIKEK